MSGETFYTENGASPFDFLGWKDDDFAADLTKFDSESDWMVESKTNFDHNEFHCPNPPLFNGLDAPWNVNAWATSGATPMDKNNSSIHNNQHLAQSQMAQVPFPFPSQDITTTTMPHTGNGTTKPKRRYAKRKSEDLGGSRTSQLTKRATTAPPLLHHSSDVNLMPAPAARYSLQKFSSYSGMPSTPMFNNNSSDNMSVDSSSDSNKGLDVDKMKQTSLFRGVSCCGKDRKWQARIRDANKVRYLGRFGTEVEAAFVYDDAARSLKGERAPTNFVQMDQKAREMLQVAFVANNYVVPESLSHLVSRGKSKNAKKGAKKASQDDILFPDSPVAKLKPSSSPVINPNVKTTAKMKVETSQTTQKTSSRGKKNNTRSQNQQLGALSFSAVGCN